jgi:uncharacterized protein (DUF58 family)
MIVPQTRLLVWFAAIALPFSVLGAFSPDALALSLVMVAGCALLAALDALLGYGRFDGITLRLPDVCRFSKGREGVIPVEIKNGHGTLRQLRLGLVLPPPLQSIRADQWIRLPATSEWSRLEWRINPSERGRFSLQMACLETPSPLGLWALRSQLPVQAEVRVYPNLFAERRNLAALFLNRGSFGVHAQRQVGKGREFEKLREYIPGDSFEDIHWKATAKRGRPVTKVFQIERTQEVYVLIDTSRLAGRLIPPTPPVRSLAGDQTPKADPATITSDGAENTSAAAGSPVLERFLTAALVLGLAAEQQGDLFGLLSFSDTVQNFVRAKNGKAHYNVCRDAIYRLTARPVTPDFEEVASFIRLRLRRRALLVFLTALDDPVLAESFSHSVDLLRRQHLVLVNMLKPEGAAPLFAEGPVQEEDDLYLRLGQHLQWHSLQELGKTLQRRGVRLSLLESEKLSAQLVSQYLAVKQRQLL